jgi:hypothetical protein
VGVVELVECFEIGVLETMRDSKGYAAPLPPRNGNERAFGNWATGRFAWQLANPRRFLQPIPYRGMQSFFDVEGDVVAEQTRQAVPA